MNVNDLTDGQKVGLWFAGAMAHLKCLGLAEGGNHDITPLGVAAYDQLCVDYKPDDVAIELLAAVHCGDDDDVQEALAILLKELRDDPDGMEAWVAEYKEHGHDAT